MEMSEHVGSILSAYFHLAFPLSLINVDVMTGGRYLKSNFYSRYHTEWKWSLSSTANLYNETVVCVDFVTFCGACGVNIRILKERSFNQLPCHGDV
jgi:hypothetical protein